MNGMIKTNILKIDGVEVNLAHDTVFDTHSIGVTSQSDCDFKMISREVYEVLKQISKEDK